MAWSEHYVLKLSVDIFKKMFLKLLEYSRATWKAAWSAQAFVSALKCLQ